MSATKRSEFLDDYPTFLSIFDLFGQDVRLHINRKYLYRTSLGGILTLIAVALALWQSYYLFSNSINHSKPVITSLENFDADPSNSIHLTPSDFIFALSVKGNQDLDFNRMILSFSLYIVTHDTMQKLYTSIPLQKCTSENFGNFSVNFPIFGMANLLCPSNFEADLRGSVLVNNFSRLELQVSRCKNGSSSYSFDYTCQSDDEIDQALANEEMSIALVYSDNVLDLLNFTHPLSKKIFYLEWPLPADSIKKTVSMKLRENVITTYSNIYSSSEQNVTTAFTIYDNWRETTSSLKDSTLFSLLLSRDELIANYTREYSTLTAVLASLGGLLKIYLAALGAVAIFYNRFSYNMEVMNEVYEFESVEDADRQKQITTWQKKLKLTTQSSKDPSQVEAQLKSMTENLAESLADKNLFFNFMQYIFSLLTGCCPCKSRLKTRRKLYKMAQRELRKDMDIIHITQKLQEFQKFKELFFNPDQLEVFAYTPKPYLKIPEREKVYIGRKRNTSFVDLRRIRRTGGRQEDSAGHYSEFRPFMKLFDAYQRLKKDTSIDSILLNKLLLKRLDTGMKQALEKMQRELEKKEAFSEMYNEFGSVRNKQEEAANKLSNVVKRLKGNKELQSKLDIGNASSPQSLINPEQLDNKDEPKGLIQHAILMNFIKRQIANPETSSIQIDMSSVEGATLPQKRAISSIRMDNESGTVGKIGDDEENAPELFENTQSPPISAIRYGVNEKLQVNIDEHLENSKKVRFKRYDLEKSSLKYLQQAFNIQMDSP